MKVTSNGIIDGIILEKYGKKGTEFNVNGVPTLSLPLEIMEAPLGTKSFALVLEDKDAIPVSGGFAWIHWVACNILKNKLEENESQKATDFIQGANSWTSYQGGNQSRELSSFYGGMCPPDQLHLYELHVYALDTVLDLKNGFYMNEMFKLMDGHILDSFTLKGYYND